MFGVLKFIDGNEGIVNGFMDYIQGVILIYHIAESDVIKISLLFVHQLGEGRLIPPSSPVDYLY
jgi:hypothetical protein